MSGLDAVRDGAVATPDSDAMVQVAFPKSEVDQLQAVLPWLVHALEERPNLTAKQRQRRNVTQQTLRTLLERIGGTPLATRPAEMADAGP